MPIFLSGLQTSERKKQGDLRDFLCFLLIHQLGVNDLTLLIPVPKCLPSFLTWLNHPVHLPVTVFITTLFWFNHPISWSWRNTLWHVALDCSASHPAWCWAMPSRVVSWQGWKNRARIQEIWERQHYLGLTPFFLQSHWYWPFPVTVIPCPSSVFVWVKAVCISGGNVQNMERASAV